MALVDIEGRSIEAKIVYFGPSMSGKTTNLLALHQLLPTEFRSDLAEIGDAETRTVYFDYLPIDAGRVDGFDLRFRVYSVSGQEGNTDARRAILTGADGVVFVANAEEGQQAANVASMTELRTVLSELNSRDHETFPVVVQINKLDLDDVVEPTALQSLPGIDGKPTVTASALNNQGVVETFRTICSLVVDSL